MTKMNWGRQGTETRDRDAIRQGYGYPENPNRRPKAERPDIPGKFESTTRSVPSHKPTVTNLSKGIWSRPVLNEKPSPAVKGVAVRHIDVQIANAQRRLATLTVQIADTQRQLAMLTFMKKRRQGRALSHT
jgi:hypothetical protein